MRRVLLIAAIALFALLPAAPASATRGDALPLVIQATDMSAYPRVALTLALPPGLHAEGSAAPDFAIRENGKACDVVSAQALSAERAPLDVVLVIDASGSMRGAPMRDAKDAASTLIRGMGPGDRVGVVSFSSRVRVATAPTSDRDVALSAVRGFRAAGETAMYDGVARTAQLLAKRKGRDAVAVLLTDGRDTASSASLDDAVAALERADVPLLAVGLKTPETDTKALKALARSSNGRMVGVGPSTELSSLFSGIAREITTQYRVVFESRRPSTKDLEIEVSATSGRRVADAVAVVENPYYTAASGRGEGVSPASPAASFALAALSVALAFGATALGSAALLSLLLKRSDRIEQLHFYDQLSAGSTEHSSTEVAGIAGAMRSAVESVAGKRGFTKALHEKLERAGLPLRPVEYMYFHIIFVVVVGLAAQLLTGSSVVAFVFVGAAAAVPILLLEAAVERRRKAFEEQLPEILSLMAGSLRSGWGVAQSVDLVAKEMGDPAASEFGRIQAATRLGLSVDEALERMADRLQSDDFRWVVTAIAIQRDVGGNLAEVFDILAATMRERAELRRHVHALTSEGRMSAVILYLLPFTMFGVLLLINPGYIAELFTTGLGIALTFTGVVLLLVGGVWLRTVTRVEV